uniref:Tc1-like transposase DDE domain-containing protein n=1 Tax=Phytophthora ramorum TaxID=164328 RepID=H3GQV4_PHYRM
MSPRDCRRVVRATRQGTLSSSGIKKQLQLTISSRTVRRFLNSTELFKYVTMNKAPKLTGAHQDDPKVRFSRQHGGRSVMVWGGFWADGTTALALLEGTQDSHVYIYTLSEHLPPAAHRRFGTEFTFQQDNASIHSSKATKAFLNEHLEKIMKSPALSPDLNPIENIWGYLMGKVYGGARQYLTKQDLIAEIKVL